MHNNITNKEIRSRQWFASPKSWDMSKFMSPGLRTAIAPLEIGADIRLSQVDNLYTLDECLLACRQSKMHEVQPETVIRYIRKQRQLAKLAQK